MTSEATILLYHGVTATPSEGIENFSGKHVSAAAFDKQMAFLKEHANVMSLQDMSEALQEKTELPPNTVAVTFDDGFRNNNSVARPILEKHGIPATFYISTGFINTSRLFWVDRVEHAINTSPLKAIELSVEGNRITLDLSSDERKITSVVAIKTRMKTMPPEQRDQTLLELEKACQSTVEPSGVENYQMMSWDELRELHASPLLEIGGHTVNHEIMSYLAPDELEFEITACLDTLRSELGPEIRDYSYPEGQSEHFNQTVIDRLKAHGITLCPSAMHGTNSAGSDPFRLKRIMVGFMGTAFPLPDAEHIPAR
ncbi:polysaccharide deacetylase family protein [Kiloniella litopenaei]|uniref:polysaccharide deacetylase family protein n=1 Tax=Kiloniella litopenaei TaxID=1549748 RepID=UPI003BAC3766